MLAFEEELPSHDALQLLLEKLLVPRVVHLLPLVQRSRPLTLQPLQFLLHQLPVRVKLLQLMASSTFRVPRLGRPQLQQGRRSGSQLLREEGNAAKALSLPLIGEGGGAVGRWVKGRQNEPVDIFLHPPPPLLLPDLPVPSPHLPFQQLRLLLQVGKDAGREEEDLGLGEGDEPEGATGDYYGVLVDPVGEDDFEVEQLPLPHLLYHCPLLVGESHSDGDLPVEQIKGPPAGPPLLGKYISDGEGLHPSAPYDTSDFLRLLLLKAAAARYFEEVLLAHSIAHVKLLGLQEQDRIRTNRQEESIVSFSLYATIINELVQNSDRTLLIFSFSVQTPSLTDQISSKFKFLNFQIFIQFVTKANKIKNFLKRSDS